MCPSQYSGQRQQGVGLPFAIFLILVLGLVGLAISALEVSSQEGVALDVQSTRAFMAAQSGVEIGINRLLPPGAAPNFCTAAFFSSSPSLSFSSPALDSCSVTVTCDAENIDGAPYYRLRSTGYCGSGESFASRIVEVGVRP